ncbi:TetR/AcrR family transcriptional regulator [Gorillibacterium sp. sgz5001074]|uniref:TetR/AcrR family transcriptional regulator n=1 Tax=Gorillibacterium sp. sgz5001074 TaxID=3446695 RepID=UPI003F66E9E9
MLRETRKRELKEQMFLKAVELFHRKGYENVTVDEIVAECGVAKGTFFNYFPKKEHVLLHLGAMQLEKLEELVAKHRGMELKDRLGLLFDGLLELYGEHAELMKYTLAETMRSSLLLQEEASNIARLQAGLQAMIREALEAGTFHSRWEPAVMAQVLTGLYFNALIAWSQQPEGQERTASQIFGEQLEVIWHGMGSTNERTGEDKQD